MDSELWGIKVLHGEKFDLPIQDNVYTMLTNISLGEINGDAPTFVKAIIKTIELDKYNESTKEAPEKTDTVLLAVLTPNKIEQISTSHHYSPLNHKVTIEVSGPNDVYLAGNYIDLSDFEEEEEEEEEVGEDAYDENQLTKTLMNAVINDKLEDEKKE